MNDMVKHLGRKITDEVTGLLIDAPVGGKWKLIWIFYGFFLQKMFRLQLEVTNRTALSNRISQHVKIILNV